MNARITAQQVHEWVHSHWPPWFCVRSIMFWVIMAVLSLGFIAGWLIGKPDPWMWFSWVTATYEKPLDGGQYELRLDGEYVIERECPELMRARVVWRLQAIPAEGQEGEVVTYVPGGEPPPVTEGRHRYQRMLVLDTSPEGLRILFIVTCPGEEPETMTSQLVTVVRQRDLPR